MRIVDVSLGEAVTPYLFLTLSAFTAQALMFVPIVPLLIASGALAAHGEMFNSAGCCVACESGE